ncbi:hypothetical protein L1987_24837 [Smallanthus sonchifolius]|uniref:Uncharacterized protein n=1 Tax=Smallanthus sonchifolius TaxID=185202 RepID=A0ACB9ILI8_9ASTR|nr:hypothetical protein L1987_24837 [Smallanthus sonchifolius]
MYAKCGDIVKARKMFDKIAFKDIVSWNSKLTGFVKHDLLVDASVTFRQMMLDGFEPDSLSVSTILTPGLPMKLVAQIHAWVIRRGTEWDLPIANSLIRVYANNGRLDSARWVFDEMPERDLVSWNSIISVHNKHPDVFVYFQPGPTVWGALLHACYVYGNVEIGEVAAENLFELEPDNNHNFKLLMQIYDEAGRVQDMERVRMMMVSRGFDL